MKKLSKIFAVIAVAALCICTLFGVAACNKQKDGVTVYAPDGAPALAIAPLMENGGDIADTPVSYKVVNASLIQTFVTGKDPAADVCILPVNAASKLLGSGETYKMLGTVTHGNLYLLKKSGDDITVDNLSSLVGKTVGVIQLAAVPGLTFKTILNDNAVAFNDLGNGSPVADKVNLKTMTPEEVLPSDKTCQYYVVPEPAATTKVTKTDGKLSFAGDLQQLYGGEKGYPQAVIVAKNSLIQENPEFIEGLTKAINDGKKAVQNGEITFENLVKAINANITEGSVSSLNAANLNMQVYNNCAINFVPSSECKEEVKSFLAKFIAISPASAATVKDEFFN